MVLLFLVHCFLQTVIKGATSSEELLLKLVFFLYFFFFFFFFFAFVTFNFAQ